MRVIVVGAGLIGLSVAWQLVVRGHAVTVVDSAPGSGASAAAAGMLAPISEVSFTDRHVLQLGLQSLELYPEFVRQVAAACGHQLRLRDAGTVLVGCSADDMAELDDLVSLHAELGVDGRRLLPSQVTQTEPGIAPSVRGGYVLPGDSHVDAVALFDALLAAVSARARIVRDVAVAITGDSGGCQSVQLAQGAQRSADVVVVAGGVHSPRVLGEDAQLVPVRPVSGATLLLRPQGVVAEPVLQHTVRAIVYGRSVYVVPTSAGEVVLGASSVERGFDPSVTVTDVFDVMRSALVVCPELGDLAIAGVRQGFRPATPDHGPIVGFVRPGVLVATGHYRHGVLLAPWTAAAVADLVENPDRECPWSPERFGSADSTQTAES